MRIHLGLTTAILLAACVSRPPDSVHTAPLSADVRDSIARTLLDAAIQDIASSFAPTVPGVAFVLVDDQDPSNAVLAHLANAPLPVAAFSTCHRQQLTPPLVGYEFRQRHTNRRGLLVFVSVEGRSDDRAAVKATYGWDHGASSMRTTTVLLESRDGHWLITSVLFDVLS